MTNLSFARLDQLSGLRLGYLGPHQFDLAVFLEHQRRDGLSQASGCSSRLFLSLTIGPWGQTLTI